MPSTIRVAMRRREDPQLITGAGRHPSDFPLPLARTRSATPLRLFEALP